MRQCWSAILQNWLTRPQARRISRRRDRRPRQLELLESRRVLDAKLLITEVVVANEEGIEDEDGDRSDWLEIYNAGDATANLGGWHLTDDSERKDKWSFPPLSLPPEQYLIVFASGKNRSDDSSPLHTNFRLQASGEYLGLTNHEQVVVSEMAPQYPALQSDRSYGLAQQSSTTVAVTEDTAVRALVPTEENGGSTLGISWTELGFDDSSWLSNSGPVGFEGDVGGYTDLIGLDLEADMWRENATAYIRIPFQIENAETLYGMTLRVKCDDGFVAYVNGTEIARRNAPGVLDWNSKATARPSDSEAKTFVDFDVSSMLGTLRNGGNLLAIHGMNSSSGSNDFLIGAELRVELPGPIQDGGYQFFQQPTPAGANGLIAFDSLVDPVSLDHERGFYESAFDLQLQTATPGASLIYTTDGSLPTLDSAIIVSPPDALTPPTATVRIDKTTTLRVAAIREGAISSPLDTHTFLLLEDVIHQDVQQTRDRGFPETWGSRNTIPDYGMDPDVVGPDDQFEGRFAAQMVESLTAVPSVSIVTGMDDLFEKENGIYANSARYGFDWERPTSVEIIGGDDQFDYQGLAGLRIAGDNVRNFANSLKQSFRLEFRGRYGPRKLRLPLFGNDASDSFDTIILRGAYNDGWVHTPHSTQYIRDTWARTTLLEMGNPQAHGRFVHVYLNGVYWGLYNAVERPNASFSSNYFGGDKDEWDALNTGSVRDGNASAWQAVRRVARNARKSDAEVSNAAVLELMGKNPDGTDNPELETLIDFDNYIDYLMVNHYGGNVDWPGRNYYVGRRQGPESTGFKYYAWDTEKILDHGEGSSLTTNRLNASDGVAEAYRSLRENEEFRLMFADRIQRHFFNGGVLHVDPASPEWDPAHPDRNVPAARYDQLAAAIETALIAESARWGDTQSTGVRKDNRLFTVDDWQQVRERLNERYFPRRSAIVLDQYVEAGLFPAVAAPVFSQHGGEITPGTLVNVEAVGDVYYTTDGSDPRQSALRQGETAGEVGLTAMQYTQPISLNGATVLRARTLVDGVWSALNEAIYRSATPSVRISELMYHPAEADDGDFSEADLEYLTVVNVSDQTIDLANLQLVKGISYRFPQFELAGHEEAVLVRNTAAFQHRYGTAVRIIGEYGATPDASRLSNGGETIQLLDSSGQTIQEFNYDDAWYPSTDGGGYSLTIRDATGPFERWNQSEGWRPSVGRGGSPGLDDAVADINRDAEIDVSDVDLFCAMVRDRDLTADLTGDGSLEDDLDFLIQDVWRTTYGDTNLDGIFDSEDLIAISQADHFEDGIRNNSSWRHGDWNCDGEFDTSDLVLAFQSGKYVANR
ncbi:MAG: hypothetical protein GY768_26950 [Planctomycetaceae bacterium]|nr:hypothetical protein [Planctomycetaceae bacterium]